MVMTHRDKKILKVFGTANQYILLNLGGGFVASVPQRVSIFDKPLWIIPVLLANSARMLGEVVIIAIDRKTCEIVGATDSAETLRKVEWLTHEKAEVA